MTRFGAARLLIVLGFIGLIALVRLTGPPPVRALATQCAISVNGEDVQQHTTPEAAIDIPEGSSVTLEANTDGGVEGGSVEIHLGPLTLSTYTIEGTGETNWLTVIPTSDYGSFGAGYYQFVGNVDQCSFSTWVNFESSGLTPAALAALGLALVGGGTAGIGLIAGARGTGGFARSTVGGAALGLGALIVAQQSGIAPADNSHLLTWTALPGGAGGLSHFFLGAITAPRRRRRQEHAARQPSVPAAGAEPTAPPLTHAPAPAPPPPTAQRPQAAPSDVVGRRPQPPPPAAAEGESAPPRSSYAHIDCPGAVVAGQAFELVVGLAREPDREVVGEPLVVPERVVGAYTMTVQVIADGFRLARSHERWRVDLRVTGEAPYPTSVLHLAADDQTRPIVARTIRAMYSIDGQAIGLAARPIAVARDAALLRDTEPPPAAEPLDISLPTDAVAPDLTVRIEIGQPAGRLLMQLLAADPEVQLPSDPLEIDIGNHPDQFLRDVIRKMNSVEGGPGMYSTLMGIGLTIAEQLPDEFWRVVADLGVRVAGRPPTILILSAEPYVPWELAVMDTPLDASRPPFLASQASVGRWVLGQRRPKLPPPSTLAVHSMAVVSGVYNMPGWDRLLDAEKEADELATKYGAAKVNADSQDVRQLFHGDPPAEVMHFAVHGQYDPHGEIDGIVLVDGLTLDPMQIRGSPLAGRPLVFLNACQVGSGEAVLGDYSGMAEAFLFAGASGVIAPIWSIDDVMAREIALRFYDKALTGRSPSDILREERAAFKDDGSTVSSTYFAYQYFGHPHMTIDRTPG